MEREEWVGSLWRKTVVENAQVAAAKDSRPRFIRLSARLLERQAVENQHAADGNERPAEPVGRVDAVIGLGERRRGKEGGVFAGAGELGSFHLLHALMQK